MAPPKPAQIRRLAEQAIRAIHAAETWASSEEEKSSSALKKRNEHLLNKYNDLVEYNTQLLMAEGQEELAGFEAAEEAYLNASSKIDELLQGHSEDYDDTASSCGSVAVPSNTKVAKLPLPKFYGELEEWSSFIQRFTSAVSGYNDLDKLQYLKSCVEGTAKPIIKNLNLVKENYRLAIGLLEKRYNNKRLNIRAFLQNLFRLPQVTQNDEESLQLVINTAHSNIQALENLELPRDPLSNELLVQLITSKLDIKTREEWETALARLDANDSDDRDTYKELMDFLEDRLRVVMSVFTKAKAKDPTPATRRTTRTALVTQASTASDPAKAADSPKPRDTVPRTCVKCGKNHALYQCDAFRELSIKDRYELVKTHKLCVNCFGHNHWSGNCKSIKCKTCGKPHHTMLHSTSTVIAPQTSSYGNKPPGGPAPTPASSTPTTQGTGSPAYVVSAVTLQLLQDVMLSTAVVKLANQRLQANTTALFDPASQVSFITTSLARKLKLQTYTLPITITGFYAKETPINKYTQIEVSSVGGDFVLQMIAFVIDVITSPLPPREFDISGPEWDFLNGYTLANPRFNQPTEIGFLIGADYVYEFLNPEFVKNPGVPTLQSSALGWLLTGPHSASNSSSFTCNLTRTQFQKLERFWEIEEPPGSKKESTTVMHKECERHFMETHSRINGRFVVRLPIRSNRAPSASRALALQRFKRLKITQQYLDFMSEYEALGHMTLCTYNNENAVFIPHHGVHQKDKLRVVFGADMKTANGLSLNDCLAVGPTIQPTLFVVLIRFRIHLIAITCDIIKMFRQVLINLLDRDWQRIFWFKDGQIAEFWLNTVTYGTTCAPFLAVRCLFQLAAEEKDRFPLAALIILYFSYMDDFLFGADTYEEAKKSCEELIQLLATAGMSLSKWCSNDPRLVPNSETGAAMPTESGHKTLGLEWNPRSDVFHFPQILLPEPPEVVTRRTALSYLSKVFDPLGLISPITIHGKLLIQELWSLKYSWDQPVTTELETRFRQFVTIVQSATKFEFPRHLGITRSSQIELHAFADASPRAYASCIYIRVIPPESEPTMTLVCSKTKVAPLRTVRTIPELELCAAVLLVELLESVAKLLNCPLKDCYAYSDSTIVLSYIAKEPSYWNAFVARRVAAIIRVCSPERWYHVPGDTNPADIATRSRASEFANRFQLWSQGPEFLRSTAHPKHTDWATEESGYSYQNGDTIVTLASFVRPTNFAQGQFSNPFHVCSSYSRLRRVWAQVHRYKFILLAKLRKQPPPDGPITALELKAADLTLIRIAQQQSFPEELRCLQQQTSLPPKSKLRSLTPIIEDGIIRVGGRLDNAELPYDQRHSIILPVNHRITELLIRDVHLRHFHAGIRFTIHILRLRYWFIGDLYRKTQKCVRNCARCIRHSRQLPTVPLMGTLPGHRVQPDFPFASTGTDFAGPILTKPNIRTRSQTRIKSYIAIFVCCATKAVHLEAVSDLSTKAFLAAFDRFVSRRGYPHSMYSDNGTNFVGANTELNKQLQELLSCEPVKNFAANYSITWHFNPPSAPHMGGLWESVVRIMKSHLYATIGVQVLTFEELTTALAHIEGIMNSRPITSLPTSRIDTTVEALTPGHFLIGRPLVAAPSDTTTSDGTPLAKRWELITQIRNAFWKRWVTDYLRLLQKRQKWLDPTPNLQVGDVVLIRAENTPPLLWPLGRVIKTLPGNDGHVRVVDVVTQNGTTLRRPVVKLIKLHVNDKDV